MISLKNTTTLVLLVFISIVSIPLPTFSQSNNDYYAEGMAELEKGEWSRALNKWMDGWGVLEELGTADPRLGIAYIELVTEKKLKHFYENASNMYLWGLSNFDLEKFEDVIKEEADRMLPLMKDDVTKEWKKLQKKDIKKLAFEMKKFWIERDPTPATPANERLLEHWERIHHARYWYNRNENSVYKCDDRGTIYVRYGDPQKIDKGTLGDNEKELAFWLPNLSVRRDINLRFNSYPEYEIWMYYSLDLYEPIMFVFGSAKEVPFGLVNGVEDFIPGRAFSRREVLPTGAAPGTYFQLMFYDRLQALHRSFSERYSEIFAIMNSSSPQGINANTLRGLRDRFNYDDSNDLRKKNAAKERSIYDDALELIKIDATAVRLLGENSEPKLAVVAISYPRRVSDDYSLTHSLVLRDANLTTLSINSETLNNDLDNTSVFLIDHPPGASSVTVGTQVTSFAQDSSGRRAATGFPAVGKSAIEGLERLSQDKTQLEMSDLVYGIDHPDDETANKFPFPVLPTKQISSGDPLQVYIEVYHLLIGSDNKASYTAKFQVEKSGKKGIVAKLRGQSKDKEVISQTSPFESNDTVDRRKVAFDVSELQPGEYEFLVEITDLLSGQSKYRLGVFKIIQ